MSNNRKRSIPKERVIAEQLMHGNLFAALPGFQTFADTVRDEIDQGLGEVQVRQRIRSRMDSEGISFRKMLLPSASRKVQRIRLRKLLRALADYMVDHSHNKTFGDVLDSISDKVGLDQWIEDSVYTYASTGEVLPILDSYTGKVWRADIGDEGDKTPTVWMVATPASDISALIEQFKDEAALAFPDETFAKRHPNSSIAGARFYRMNQEGMSYSQIAYNNAYELFPEFAASDDDKEFNFFTEFVVRETERVKKLAQRTHERGDIIALYKSPED